MRPMIARLFAAALCGFPLALHAQAQAYPSRAVRIVGVGVERRNCLMGLNLASRD